MGKTVDRSKQLKRAEKAYRRMKAAEQDLNAAISTLQILGWKTTIKRMRINNPVLRRGYDHVFTGIEPVTEEERSRETQA